MRPFTSLSLVLALALAPACAPDIDIDEGERVDELPETDGPTVEFDPAAQIIPFPNNLLIDRETGRVNLPEQCLETPAQAALREMVLNTLDGFGTFKPALSVTFSEPVAAASLEGNVHLLRRATAGEPVDPSAATQIPVVVFPGVTGRFSADCADMAVVDNAVIVPLIPLEGQSTYVVALTSGIATASDEPFLPSPTWALVRQAENPVTVEDGVIVADRTPFDPVTDAERLLGLNLLWNAHAQALAFLDAALGAERSDILLAWEFNTQTVTDPLDPEVAGSLAADLPMAPLAEVTPITADPQAFLEQALPGDNTCAALPCAAVGAIVAGGLAAPNYQVDLPNPIGGDPIQGPWPDPIAPELASTDVLTALACVPSSEAPANGYPTVVFGHGLTRSKNDLFAICSQLASQGIASVAIDWVSHGDRAVQVSNDPQLGCSGEPDPTEAPQCFVPILSADLAATRDSVRQSALDALALIEALQACGTDSCGALQVDAGRIGYLGQSLGGIIGTVVVAMSPDIGAGVLNVAGVGWIDIFENTDSIEIRCSVVDALIAAGVIEGEPLDLTVDPPVGTCLGEEWKQQPAYQRFANIARWVLDPGEPANYVDDLGATPVLIQEVAGDAVVPNFATEQLGSLAGLGPLAADVAVPPPPVGPSEAVTTDITEPKRVRYEDVPPDADTGFPGNTYEHGSLLSPADGNAGQLATQLMQTDAITYLLSNLSQ